MLKPYFIENLILATPDNGIAAVIYGACEAKATVADGTEIVITEDTQYPFDGAISFKIGTSKVVKFPFYLRIPTWTKGATLEINGEKVSIDLVAGKYACINREWKDGDVVTVKYPMDLTMKTWQVNKNSVSVNYGPLTLSLNIDEEYKKVNSKETAIWDSKWQENADPSQWPSYEIYAKSAWNYALVLGKKNPLSNLTIEKRVWPTDDYPFTQQSSPLLFKAKGRLVPSWQIDQYKLCGVLPDENVDKSDNVDDITLVPMGTARLRITSFPVSYE